MQSSHKKAHKAQKERLKRKSVHSILFILLCALCAFLWLNFFVAREGRLSRLFRGGVVVLGRAVVGGDR